MQLNSGSSWGKIQGMTFFQQNPAKMVENFSDISLSTPMAHLEDVSRKRSINKSNNKMINYYCSETITNP